MIIKQTEVCRHWAIFLDGKLFWVRLNNQGWACFVSIQASSQCGDKIRACIYCNAVVKLFTIVRELSSLLLAFSFWKFTWTRTPAPHLHHAFSEHPTYTENLKKPTDHCPQRLSEKASQWVPRLCIDRQIPLGRTRNHDGKCPDS